MNAAHSYIYIYNTIRNGTHSFTYTVIKTYTT